MIIIKYCGCLSAFQDSRYGVGLRVHNSAAKDTLRCTGCGKPSCDKLVKIRGNTTVIEQMDGKQLRPGMWTCLGIA